MKYFLVLVVIVLVTYGQLMIKHRVNLLGPAPALSQWHSTASYLFRALTDVGIISGLLAAVGAAMAWMLALSRFEISAVYPLLAINFLLVPMLSILLFGEQMNWIKGVGLVIVVIGLVIFSYGLQVPKPASRTDETASLAR